MTRRPLASSPGRRRAITDGARARGVGLALAGLADFGCSRPPRDGGPEPVAMPAPASGALPAAAPASAAQRARLTSCSSLGLLACDRAPSTHAALCASSSPCIAEHATPPSHFEGLTFACDPDDAPGSTQAGFTPSQPAPPASGISALSLMNVVAQNDVGMMRLAASYLVADLPEGACLVDRVHDWDARPGYVETQLEARWLPSASGFRVSVRSRRIEHEPLDESESGGGVSDVRSDACRSLTYDVTGGRFERVAEQATVGPCPALAADAPGPR